MEGRHGRALLRHAARRYARERLPTILLRYAQTQGARIQAAVCRRYGMSDELKPCPFCGGAASIVRRDVEPQGDPWYGQKKEDFPLCQCGACLFDGSFHEGFYDPAERALKAWNSRPTEDALQAKLAIAIEALEWIQLTPKWSASSSGKAASDAARDALSRIKS